jgi:glycosyltransferase involved in cell wall biosynthesis
MRPAGARRRAEVSERVHVLELRSVRGTGGGPEKTILLGAALTDPSRFHVTVAYIRDERDAVFGIDAWAQRLDIDYVEVRERHSFDPAIWQRLRTLIRQRRIDIVHAHDYKTNALALLLARYEGIIPLATEHGWTGHSWRERGLYYPADKWLARFFPQVLAVSSNIRQELVRRGAPPERVTTILNGIDPRPYRRSAARRAAIRAAMGLAETDVVLGSVGRLEPQKRFDLLIQAVAGLRAELPGLRLLIAGDGSERARLESLSRRAGLDDRCTCLGHRTDVADLHHALDVYVQSSDYEGTPNTVLEAMAMETPVVATDAGGTRELAAHDVHALIVPPGDVPALQAAIRRAIAEPDATAARTRAARQRIETDLSFQTRTRRLEDVYAVLHASRGPKKPAVSEQAA